MPWQVILGGTWKDVDVKDEQQLQFKYDKGLTKFQITSRGMIYDINLEGTNWTQTNPKTKKNRQIRLWPPPDQEEGWETNEPTKAVSVASVQSGISRQVTSLAAVGMPTGSIDAIRVYVWRSNDWHPVSPSQEKQIKDNLKKGIKVFEVTEGPNTWTIDTQGKTGWVQLSSKGKRRSMKFVEGTSGAASSSSRSLGPSSSTSGTDATDTPIGTDIIESIRKEWKAISQGHSQVLKEDVIRAWQKSLGSSDCDAELLYQTASDVFLKMDLQRNKYLDTYEFMHYRLLEFSASSFHSLSGINEKLLDLIRRERKILSRLIATFENNLAGETKLAARLTAPQMRNAAAAWLKDTGGFQAASHLKQISEGVGDLDEDEDLTYYDFMNHILGRKKVSVQLYHYDLSHGKAWWLSPILLGKYFEGIWHTGVVVHDKEYWFGGKIFESEPGCTPFGTPTKIIDMPEQTMRTKEDLWAFIRRELVDEFTAETYDVLTHNCNHFSDAVCQFLINQHIPEDVLNQPDEVMGTWTAQVLRPVLNRMLGRFEVDDSDLDSGGRVTDEATASDDWSCIQEGGLVTYEHDEGWTCIARVLQKFDETCHVQWLNVQKGKFMKKDVDKSSVMPLLLRSEARRRSKAGGWGLFATCYHPTAL